MKYKRIICAGAAALVIAGGITLGINVTKPYAVTADGEKIDKAYNVCIDGEEVALVESEEAGNEIIEDIENYYVSDDADVKSIDIKQDVTVEEAKLERGFNAEHPEVSENDEVVDFIMCGTEEKKTYTVEAGDTAWAIAEENDISLDTLEDWNKDSNLEMLSTGDEINLYEENPLVDVTTVEKVTYTKKIKYKTKIIKTDELTEGETKVKKEGRYGEKEVTANLTKENGETVDKDILSSEVTKKPVTQVIYKGTRPAGQSVVDYAMKFLGNPYVWGGSSLTNGTDCSGFTMSVYAHFGYGLPHSSYAQENCGKEVPYSEAKPGDLICYGPHVALYIGNGMIIHASSPSTGIILGSAAYRPIKCVRRIIY